MLVLVVLVVDVHPELVHVEPKLQVTLVFHLEIGFGDEVLAAIEENPDLPLVLRDVGLEIPEEVDHVVLALT